MPRAAEPIRWAWTARERAGLPLESVQEGGRGSGLCVPSAFPEAAAGEESGGVDQIALPAEERRRP